MDLYITIGIICLAIFLFVKDYFTIDTTSILIMVLFIISGVLSPEEGFSGFNHPATLTLGCMFVVSAGVFNSGIIDSVSNRIVKIARSNYVMALITFCTIAAVFSAFVNDAVVVAILIPLALSVCRETSIPPSKLLIPISFSALFGGTCTLIGTSTNILVSSIAKKSGFEPFGMFEFSLPALCLLGIGMLYLFFIAPILLPKRKSSQSETFDKVSENYITELQILKDNKDIGKTIKESDLVLAYNAQVISIHRNNLSIEPINSATINEGDILKVSINAETITKFEENGKYHLFGNKQSIDEAVGSKSIIETMVPVGSRLANKSIAQERLRSLYKISVLAIRQREEVKKKELSNIKIKEGDMLLIHADADAMNSLSKERILVSLSSYKVKKINMRKAVIAILVMVGVVLAAAIDLTSILISAMVGSMVLILTSVLKPKEAYEAIEWKVIFMIAGVLSMGNALEKTGGAEMIADFVFNYFGEFDPRIMLSLIFLVSFLSTNVLSSKATAALMAPIVIGLSSTLGLSEKPFLIAVMFACSLTFMTPVSYPTNTMVYAPGNYKFNDFLKVGTPLNVVIWIAASFIIPFFFPF
ncbi:MAG: SLC13 family permease [Brumimicrobium sp.]